MEPNQDEEQFCEGCFSGCRKHGCYIENCCKYNLNQGCVNEYFLFQEKMKDILILHGVDISFENGMVFYRNCVDGNDCKFLKYAPDKNVDPRPFDCKIYPYTFDWSSVDFNEKIVFVYCGDNHCPIVIDKKEDEEFRKEVKEIVKRNFALLFNGAKFRVQFFKGSEFK